MSLDFNLLLGIILLMFMLGAYHKFLLRLLLIFSNRLKPYT